MDATTRYARRDGAHVAYQVIGDGPAALVLVGEWCTHVEVQWEEPSLARTLERLAGFARVVLFDKRGVGCSDPVPLRELPTLEDWMHDVVAVLDAAGIDRAAVLGVGAGGFMSLLLAAAHPERVSALVLLGASARIAADDGYPGVDAADLHAAVPWTERHWGSAEVVDLAAPSRAHDGRFREWYGRHQRLAASPGTATAMQAMLVEVDAREVLPSIHVPTLVLHRRDDHVFPVTQGRYLAEHVAGARFGELPGEDHLWFCGETRDWIGEVEELLTGSRTTAPVDRALATVLFTDIVGSTVRAAALGDEAWRELLDRHDLAVRRQIERFGGRVVSHTGDGWLATFDGPASAIAAARAARSAVRALGLEVRAGVHTGEVELRGDDIGGIAVHLGARVAAAAGPSEILVSRTVVDLVAGSGLRFESRGVRELRGVPGTWELHAVADPEP